MQSRKFHRFKPTRIWYS